MRKLRSSGVNDSSFCSQDPRLESRSRQLSSNGCFGRYHVDIFLHRHCGSRDRQVVTNGRCGRSNPGSILVTATSSLCCIQCILKFFGTNMQKLRSSAVQDSVSSDPAIVWY